MHPGSLELGQSALYLCGFTAGHQIAQADIFERASAHLIDIIMGLTVSLTACVGVDEMLTERCTDAFFDKRACLVDSDDIRLGCGLR